MKNANLALKFGLELAALAAFAYWGTTLSGTALSVVAAIAAPLAAAVLWSVCAAPRSPRRLSLRLRIPFELTVFALASGALAATGEAALAIALAAVAAGNAILLTRFAQWED